MKHLLSIAGSDPSGGAGIQADLKTFAACGTYGMGAITALTAQNTCGVQAIHDLPAEFVRSQLESVCSDIRVDGIKLGMLSRAPVIQVVAEFLALLDHPRVVLDPVMIAKSGHPLLDPAARTALVEHVLPLAAIVTPNIPEAAVLSGLTIHSVDDMVRAGERILSRGARAVLVKGGHGADLPGSEGKSLDVLVMPAGTRCFSQTRLDARHTHGTGCALSAALASRLALGDTLEQAVAAAKDYVTGGIRQGLAIGSGIGPIHHFHQWFPLPAVEAGS